MYHSLLPAVLSLSVLLGILAAAHAASYNFTTVDVPDATNTQVFGINTAGQIVGVFNDATGRYGFVRDGATFTTIDVPGSTDTMAFGMNTAGQIVGQFTDATGLHGFVRDGAMFTTIDVPGSTGTVAHGMNTAGQIAGYFIDPATGGRHGFVRNGATFTTFDVPGATHTQARGINMAGQIVGDFDDATGTHGFLRDGTTFATFDVPGADSTTAWGINTAGQIVGQFNDLITGTHGFVKDGATFTTIDVPSSRDTEVYGINTAGQIVGGFGSHGFVAIPEPTTSPAILWIGLKNSDDQGTAFDLQAEVAIDSAPVATARTLCIAGVIRNPDKAREVMIQFGSLPPLSVAPGHRLSLTVRTRIGTNPNGTKCAGHSNAIGLRLYYDSTSRSSRISAQLTSDSMQDFFLHSSSNVLFLDESDPTATTAKFKDSAGVNFAGGNPWKEIGTWSMTLP